jgi:NADPH-dependent curcumin reductase CurA
MELDKAMTAEQNQKAEKYITGVKVGQEDLYASRADYQNAMQRVTVALKPVPADLAMVPADQQAALQKLFGVSQPASAPGWGVWAAAGGVGLAALLLLGRRRRVAPASMPARKRRVMRGTIRGTLKFGRT